MSGDNLSKNNGKTLLKIARASIAQELGITDDKSTLDLETADWLQQEGASFITLMLAGQLRGCIGSLEAKRSLLEDIKANAISAALKDTRFSPLSSSEVNDIQIEISVLSPVQELCFEDEESALNLLQPDIDGVIFEFDQHRSTFLPQVWQQLPQRIDFMAHLKQKAGLSADFWSDEVKLFRYTVSKWKETDFDDLFD